MIISNTFWVFQSRNAYSRDVLSQQLSFRLTLQRERSTSWQRFDRLRFTLLL